MIATISNSLADFSVLISRLTDEQFTTKIVTLNSSTIGEHTRHIIELYQSLMNGYEEGMVDYDKRKRDTRIQTSTDFAFETLKQLELTINQPDKKLFLQVSGMEGVDLIATNFYRELLYNFEHCIHHQALIRVALKELNIEELLDPNFGVAPSTIAYRANVYS